MTIIEDFRRELQYILSTVVKKHLPYKDVFKAFTHEDKTLSFPKQVARSYQRAIRILRLKSKNVGKLISDKKLEDLLDEFLVEFKYGDETKAKEEIDKHIVKLFEKLKSMQTQRYLFLIPIMRMRLAQDIIIGDSALVNLDEQTLASLETKYSVKLRFGDRSLSQAASEMVKRNETSVFAAVMIQAPDDEKALELAIQKTDTCLNILRLYYSTAPFVVRDEFRSEFPRGMVRVKLDENIYGEMLARINLVANVPLINSKTINGLKEVGFEEVNRLLVKEANELTPLQRDILTAIFWFGNAVKETQRNMKFIKSAIALETLLAPDGGIGKRDRISRRFASIVYSEASDDEKKEVFREMQSLYDIRNSIIHSGEGYTYEDDLVQIMHWAQGIILFLLPYAEKANDIFELIEKEFPIDKNIYSEL